MKELNGVAVYDSLAELIDPQHTALLVVDVQNDFCHEDGHFARAGKDMSMIRASLPTMREFVAEAQACGIRCVFIRQGTLPNGQSDSPAWLRFKTRDGKSPEYTLVGSWGWQLVDGLTPGNDDLVVEKFRPDAFIQTNLEQLLRANGIETVVVLGVISEGCVESTVRGASYRDFYVVVAKDAIASCNPTLHAGSLRLFEARYPNHRSEEILAVWRDGGQEMQAVS